MDFSFIELLFDSCCEGLDFIDYKSTEAEKNFINTYIESEFQTGNDKAGFAMEADFNAALADSSLRAFKNGFRTCMHLILESVSTEP